MNRTVVNRILTLTLRDRVSLRVSSRGLLVVVVLLVVLLALGAVTALSGEPGLTWRQLLALPWSPPDGAAGFMLERVRAPRFLTALFAGMALGVSGALFQTVTRNPLGSPEIIGLTSGAAAGAAAATLWPGYLPVPVAAVAGGAVAVLAVWLGTGRGFSSPGRLIVVGIAVSAVASALTGLAMTRTGDQEAQTLAFYLNGNLASRSWTDVATIGAVVVILVPAVIALSRHLDLIAVGDELADALGARVAATRSVAVALAVLLAGAAVSVCGPIAFVALVAPQIAVRLTGGHFPGVLGPALLGGVLLTAADLVSQSLNLSPSLPVGIFTAGIGSVYLGYLLLREARKGTL